MPREFNIVIHTAYDDLYPVESCRVKSTIGAHGIS
jgi:hypothetical protein